jgi:hypothetical protein
VGRALPYRWLSFRTGPQRCTDACGSDWLHRCCTANTTPQHRSCLEPVVPLPELIQDLLDIQVTWRSSMWFGQHVVHSAPRENYLVYFYHPSADSQWRSSNGCTCYNINKGKLGRVNVTESGAQFHACSVAFIPGKRSPWNQWRQSRSGHEEEIPIPNGHQCQVVQPNASQFTDWVIPALTLKWRNRRQPNSK